LIFGKNELNGTPGFLAILHTWDQKLQAHFHLHCLVAGGAVSKDKKLWLSVKNDYLFNEEALSQVFRGKFMQRLGHVRKTGALKFAGAALWQLQEHAVCKKLGGQCARPCQSPRTGP
jgi:hypothetical protein